MSRYINAEPWESMGASVKFEYPNKCGDTLIGHIMMRDIHTADVVPVVHGWWEKRFCHPMRDGEWQYICSVCKNDNYWRNNVCHQKHRYCPNCGAKMDGGADNG